MKKVTIKFQLVIEVMIKFQLVIEADSIFDSITSVSNKDNDKSADKTIVLYIQHGLS